MGDCVDFTDAVGVDLVAFVGVVVVFHFSLPIEVRVHVRPDVNCCHHDSDYREEGAFAPCFAGVEIVVSVHL